LFHIIALTFDVLKLDAKDYRLLGISIIQIAQRD